MKPLTLYFNELSAPEQNITTDELQNWSPLALSLLFALRKVGQYKTEYTVAFTREQLQGIYAKKPLRIWFKEWLNREQFRWLLAKIQNVNVPEDLLHQVYFQGREAIGLTFACIAESWAFSFPKNDSPWISHSVTATEYYRDGDNISDQECNISLIANEQHVDLWREELYDWGNISANNNTICTVSGHSIVMYPMDHGYPHIHLIDAQSVNTLAKFRIDKFERMEGPPKWDTEMQEWINDNKKSLMRSWERCKCGGHPYRI